MNPFGGWMDAKEKLIRWLQGLVILSILGLGLFLLAATFRSLPLSRISYTLIFLFLCLHAVGAHYTYSLVPYAKWIEALTGVEVGDGAGLDRNHFDRIVHFCYGLLLAYPVREIFLRVAAVRGFWGYFLPLDLTMSTSMGYELLEWGAAEFFGGDLGVAFLGTQGDPWDAQKDMALASLGALVAMSVTAGLNRYLQPERSSWSICGGNDARDVATTIRDDSSHAVETARLGFAPSVRCCQLPLSGKSDRGASGTPPFRSPASG